MANRWRLGCRAADVIWLEAREERVARQQWRQERVNHERFEQVVAHVRKTERRCPGCGRHYGCNCGPEPIAWLDES